MFTFPNFRFPVDLQYFSEVTGGEPAPASDPAPSTGGYETQADAQPVTNPLLEQGIFGEEMTPAMPIVTDAPSVQTLDFGGRSVPVADPVLMDLHKDWTELNRFAQATNQRAQQAEMQLQQMQQWVQWQQQQQMMQQQQQVAPPAPTREEIEQRNQQFLDRFYENPLDALNDYTRQIAEQTRSEIMGYVQPIIAERNFQGHVQAVTQKYGENLAPYSEEMSTILRENPHIEQMPNPVETLYLMAKGRRADMLAQQMSQQVPRSVDDVLNNPEWREQIYNNPQLQQHFVNNYLKTVQQKQQQAPTVMGNQNGMSQVPVTPSDAPKTIKEGSARFREWFRNQQ